MGFNLIRSDSHVVKLSRLLRLMEEFQREIIHDIELDTFAPLDFTVITGTLCCFSTYVV